MNTNQDNYKNNYRSYNDLRNGLPYFNIYYQLNNEFFTKGEELGINILEFETKQGPLKDQEDAKYYLFGLELATDGSIIPSYRGISKETSEFSLGKSLLFFEKSDLVSRAFYNPVFNPFDDAEQLKPTYLENGDAALINKPFPLKKATKYKLSAETGIPNLQDFSLRTYEYGKSNSVKGKIIQQSKNDRKREGYRLVYEHALLQLPNGLICPGVITLSEIGLLIDVSILLGNGITSLTKPDPDFKSVGLPAIGQMFPMDISIIENYEFHNSSCDTLFRPTFTLPDNNLLKFNNKILGII